MLANRCGNLKKNVIMEREYVYAFQYCFDIHESGYATLSLHKSEKGAQMAMEFHKAEKKKEFDEMYKDDNKYNFSFGEYERWQVYRMYIEA